MERRETVQVHWEGHCPWCGMSVCRRRETDDPTCYACAEKRRTEADKQLALSTLQGKVVHLRFDSDLRLVYAVIQRTDGKLVCFEAATHDSYGDTYAHTGVRLIGRLPTD